MLPDIGSLCLFLGVLDSYIHKQRIEQRYTMATEAETVLEEIHYTQQENNQRRETGKLCSPSAYRITAFK